MIIHKMQQGSEAWHQIKLGRFSGTRIGKLLMGKSTSGYQNAIAEVAAEILTRETEENFVSDDMQRGIDLEPQAATIYSSIFEVDLQEVGFIEPEHELSEWTGVSPDRLIDSDGMLEIKCPKVKTLFKYIEKNVLPLEYRPQVQGQLWVAKRQWCDFMAYYPNLKPFIIRVYPDLDLHKKIEEELKIAVQSVKNIIKMYNNYDYLK
jgi:hypothetical protein